MDEIYQPFQQDKHKKEINRRFKQFIIKIIILPKHRIYLAYGPMQVMDTLHFIGMIMLKNPLIELLEKILKGIKYIKQLTLNLRMLES